MRSSSSWPRGHSRLLRAGVELQLLVGVQAGLVDDLDALVEQGGVHELDLLGGEVDLREDLGDVFRRDEATAAAELDEPVDFLDIDYPAFRRRSTGQLTPPESSRCTVRVSLIPSARWTTPPSAATSPPYSRMCSMRGMRSQPISVSVYSTREALRQSSCG